MLTLQTVKCNMNMKRGGNGEGFCWHRQVNMDKYDILKRSMLKG